MRSSVLLPLAAMVVLAGCGSSEPAASSGATELAAAPPSVEGAEPATEPEGAEPEGQRTAESEPAPEAEPEVDTAPHEVVLLSVHDDELLRSEQRLLDVIEERMRMRRIDAIEREASEAEASWARAHFSGEGAGGAMPATLAGASVVLVLRFPPNRELEGGRATRGLGGVLAFRAGQVAPFFEAGIDDVSAWRVPDEQLWPWLISLVRAEIQS